MAAKGHGANEDENISMIHGREPWKKGKKHTDSKSIIIEIISEIEHHDLVFSREEIVKKAVKQKIPAAEAEAVIDDLMKSHYLRYVHGTEGLLTRNVWRDFGEIEEEHPEF